MATRKIGIYRSYYGPIPQDENGQPLPKKEWIKKRPHSWVARWFGHDGKRYSKSFETRKEAQRYTESKQLEVREQKADPPPRLTLRDYYREHRDLMQGNLAKKTLQMHLAAIALLSDSVGWDRRLDQISVRDIESFRAQRLKAGISPSSANRELRTLRRIFNLAILRGYLAQNGNPCAAIPMIKVGRKRPAYCSSQEFQAICRRSPDVMWRALLVLIYTTGLRLREALNLTWNHIDFDAEKLHVTRKTASAWVQAWTPKDHEMRTIPLPQQAISLLAAWQSVAPEKCPYVFMEDNRWKFYCEAVLGGQWAEGRDLVNNVLRRFKTLCRQAGVGPYTLHDLRRSCITNWAQCLPMHVVQQLAGHSDIKTTQQYYLSVRPEDVAKAQEVQQSLLGNIPSADPTDQKMTNSGRKRVFPGKQGCRPKTQIPL